MGSFFLSKYLSHRCPLQSNSSVLFLFRYPIIGSTPVFLLYGEVGICRTSATGEREVCFQVGKKEGESPRGQMPGACSCKGKKCLLCSQESKFREPCSGPGGKLAPEIIPAADITYLRANSGPFPSIRSLPVSRQLLGKLLCLITL